MMITGIAALVALIGLLLLSRSTGAPGHGEAKGMFLAFEDGAF